MEKCKSDIMFSNVLQSILKTGVRGRNIKVLLETFTYIAITETATNIITTETVM